jgi:CRP-like cAMP-binding protein
VQVDVAAADVVIRAGEVGDRFYLVGHGQLTIEAASQRVSLGPGDFFGEIALLHDVPRTATVRANSDVRLYALERDDFLAVMTGNSLARTQASAVATERLEADAAALRRAGDE